MTKRKNSNTKWAFIIIILIGILSLELTVFAASNQLKPHIPIYAGIPLMLIDMVSAPLLIAKASESKISIKKYIIIEVFGIPASFLLLISVMFLRISSIYFPTISPAEPLAFAAISAAIGVILLSSKRPRIKACILVVIALLAAISYLYYISGYTSYAKIIYAITPISHFNNQTAKSLKLSAYISENTISYGSNVIVTITLLNSDSHPYKLYLGNYPINNPPGCNGWDYPFGYNVYAGYHTVNDISNSSSLILWKPENEIYFFCAGPSVTSDNFYYIAANTSVSASITINGFWTMQTPGNFSTDKFSYFTPGTYTVVAEDEWGQMATTHFTVVNSSR